MRIYYSIGWYASIGLAHYYGNTFGIRRAARLALKRYYVTPYEACLLGGLKLRHFNARKTLGLVVLVQYVTSYVSIANLFQFDHSGPIVIAETNCATNFQHTHSPVKKRFTPAFGVVNSGQGVELNHFPALNGGVLPLH